ncbi:SemiSWEET transporter [Pigmentibacter sp. JX0631]|uniref:SemiSWEET transporter n=1 Tax=Pigmentibacter sp. JX0631 TaxID=2976982 RepID=UPI002468CC2A|nr:SemiSWEET transporter [Pigmentibacter sp. JX0631]WGL60401.1 SemiSWEET transporter [Pigmentibacter sp. JX0631]
MLLYKHLIIGYIAAFLTTSSFLPQAIKTIKTKDTSGISLVMYSMFCSGVFLWLIYGIMIFDLIIIIANLVTFIISFLILLICFANLKNKNKRIK